MEKMSDTEKKEVLWKILFGKQSNLKKPKETKKKKKNQGNKHKQDKQDKKDKKEDKKDQGNQQKQDKTDQDPYYVEEPEEDEEESESEDSSSDDSSSTEDEDDHHYYLQKAFNSIFSLISVEEFFIKNEEIDLCDKFFEIYLQKIQDSIEELKGLKSNLKFHFLYIKSQILSTKSY